MLSNCRWCSVHPEGLRGAVRVDLDLPVSLAIRDLLADNADMAKAASRRAGDDDRASSRVGLGNGGVAVHQDLAHGKDRQPSTDRPSKRSPCNLVHGPGAGK